MLWYDVVWYNMVCMVWHDIVRYYLVGYDMAWDRMAWDGMPGKIRLTEGIVDLIVESILGLLGQQSHACSGLDVDLWGEAAVG